MKKEAIKIFIITRIKFYRQLTSSDKSGHDVMNNTESS